LRDQKVGIGTTAPIQPLEVKNTASAYDCTIQVGANGVAGEDREFGQFAIRNNHSSASGAYVKMEGFRDGGNTYAGAKFYTTENGTAGERLRITSSGILKTAASISEYNGVRIQCFGGYTAGNQSASHSFSATNPNAFRVIAQFSHHNVGSYGCFLDAIYGYYHGHAGLQSTNELHRSNSGGGGNFQVSRSGTSNTFEVTKAAGTYGGGGYYSIMVISGCPAL
jgi:hypothetical protein